MVIYDSDPGFLIDQRVSEAYQSDLERTFRLLPHQATVLEVGCGSGVFTQWLSDQYFRVMGADRSEAQLAQARQRLPHIDFVQRDIEIPAEVDAIAAHGQFDLLVCRYVIHELADPINTFAAWSRLLKPDGQLVLIENAWVRDNWGSSDWGKRSDDLPLACTQTWATAAYCLNKAGYRSVKSDWMHHVNALYSTRDVSGFRLYVIAARMDRESDAVHD